MTNFRNGKDISTDSESKKQTVCIINKFEIWKLRWNGQQISLKKKKKNPELLSYLKMSMFQPKLIRYVNISY